MIKFLQSKTNESVKRLIAFLFAITLIVIIFLFCGSVIWLLYYGKPVSEIIQIIITIILCIVSLIALLLGLATVETILEIVKKVKTKE